MVHAQSLMFTRFWELSGGVVSCIMRGQTFRVASSLLSWRPSGEEPESPSLHFFLTVSPPIGSLLISSANKDRLFPVMTNEDDSVLSAVVKNNDCGSQHPPRRY